MGYPASRPEGTRYASVDALRGLIMMLMAIDHSSAVIARQHASEFWSGAMSAYTSAFPFLTRLVTHLCAPGFFFLMGAGLAWFAASRRAAGWSEAAIARRAALRGLTLLLVAQIGEAPLMLLQNVLAPAEVSLNTISAPPPNDGSDLYWGLITLSGLGLVLTVCAGLLRLPKWTWLAVSAMCLVATNSLLPESGRPAGWWHAVLLVPGLSQHLLVVYPVAPWLAGAAAGMWFGAWWRCSGKKAEGRVWIIGASLVAAGLILRAAGGWGNLRPPRDAGWIEFLNNVKYPPSAVFWTLFLGVDLLLLGVLARLPERWRAAASPLIVFGQTPLFFYLAHFYLLVGIALLFFRKAGSLAEAYGVWVLVLVLLYPACVWYRGFKMRKEQESMWRMF
jgi:uncharacterized membrane protein